MNPLEDVNNAKYLILDNLGKAIKLIQHNALTEGLTLDNESRLLQSLAHSLDLNLRHGLIDPHTGYWPLVQQLTHSATKHIINSLTAVHSPLGRGRAWLYVTLCEGSLGSYLECLAQHQPALVKHYAPHALVRDGATRERLVRLVAGLENVQFQLDADVSYLEVSTYRHQTLQMTSSATSSLASPPDSGVVSADSDNNSVSLSLQDDDSSVLPGPPLRRAANIRTDSSVEATERALETPQPEARPAHRTVTDGDEIVYRRQRRKRPKNDTKVKRVSFHEDLVEERNGTINGRYSWSGEGGGGSAYRANDGRTRYSDGISLPKEVKAYVLRDQFSLDQVYPTFDSGEDMLQMEELFPNAEKRTSKMEELFSDAGKGVMRREEVFPETGKGAMRREEVLLYTGKGVTKGEEVQQGCGKGLTKREEMIPDLGKAMMKIRMAERGVPEGQEDPPKSGSTLRLCVPSDRLADTDSDIGKRVVCSGKRITETDARKRLARSLYLRARPLDLEGNDVLAASVTSHVSAGRAAEASTRSDVLVSDNLAVVLRAQVTDDEAETLYKVFRVRSCYTLAGSSAPLLLLLTDVKLYVTGVADNHSYCNQLVVPYGELHHILVGPCHQSVVLVCGSSNAVFLLATGDREVTVDLVARVEVAMRRRAPREPPAVTCVHLEDMATMRRSLLAQDAIRDEEELCHYSLVFVQDHQASAPTTPLGPTKQGHLMYRTANHDVLTPWAPGYFILKAGVLYQFDDQAHRLPRQLVSLTGGRCKGCGRLRDGRPHTFHLSLGWAKAMHFAAADEYETSDWLQAFLQAASGVYESSRDESAACTLLLTSHRVVTCVEEFPTGRAAVLSVANIADLAAFHAERSWCVLEFSCREVHENSGDWILYFASAAEMQSFQATLRRLWARLKQAEFPCGAAAELSVGARCVETEHLLRQAWDHLLPALA